MKVYIAGPMRGYEAYNFPAFFEAEAKINAYGVETFNPARKDVETYSLGLMTPRDAGNHLLDMNAEFDLRGALGADLAWICANADAIIVLPGFEKSSGAKAEVATASALHIPVYMLDQFLDWLETKDDIDEAQKQLVEAFTRPECVRLAAEQEPVRDESGKFVPSEVRTTSSTGGQKGVKPERHSLIPKQFLDGVARVYAFGAQKYADHNWRKGYEWSKSYDALMRHLTAFWDGETLDPESGLPHLDHAGFHIAALRTWLEVDGEGSQFDDRFRRADG